jgi:isopropylmalate/homocitrate/citramalate synthase
VFLATSAIHRQYKLNMAQDEIIRTAVEGVYAQGRRHERPEIVHAAVTYLTRSGEETVVGSSIIRRDVREAAVRSVLDAINRRVSRLMSLGASA